MWEEEDAEEQIDLIRRESMGMDEEGKISFNLSAGMQHKASARAT